ARAKQYLLTGDMVSAPEAQGIGLINVCVPPEALDATVDKWATRLSTGASNAIKWTKPTINIGLKDQAAKMLDAGLGYEALSLRSSIPRKERESHDRPPPDRATLCAPGGAAAARSAAAAAGGRPAGDDRVRLRALGLRAQAMGRGGTQAFRHSLHARLHPPRAA